MERLPFIENPRCNVDDSVKEEITITTIWDHGSWGVTLVKGEFLVLVRVELSNVGDFFGLPREEDAFSSIQVPYSLVFLVYVWSLFGGCSIEVFGEFGGLVWVVNVANSVAKLARGPLLVCN